MRLKSIHMKGFKSFADKLNLDFGQGITSIVGPNGSGKSNIVDAIKWVLGEQSVKSLRGSSMQEVIFSGTEFRKPLGFAEVSIIIDNSNNKLKSDFTEIEVKRRIYRSGESEYYINNSSCRLKDVTTLFLDTGIGKEGYSIIGQGKIDQILDNKPSERKKFFEEATGISTYRVKLSEAERKLKSEKDNLIRINDIVLEIDKQIQPLKSQANKAKKYLALKEELTNSEVGVCVYEYKNVIEELEKLELKKYDINNKIKENTDVLNNIKSMYNNDKAKYDNMIILLDDNKNSISNYEIEIEKYNGECKVFSERISNLFNNIESDSKKVEDIISSVKSKNILLAEINENINNYQQRVQENSKVMQDKQDAFNINEQKLIDKSKELEETKDELVNLMNLLNESKTEKEKNQIILANLNNKLLEKDEEINKINYNISELEDDLRRFKFNLEKEVIEKDKKEKILVTLNENQIDLKGELNKKEEEKYLLLKDLHNSNSKYNVYLEMKKHNEGFSKSVKSILDKKNSNEKICGVVGDIIEVDKKYETSIEVSLGGKIQNIITDDSNTAKQMINYLKINNLGRATFLPLDNVNSVSSFNDKEFVKEDGVIDIASNLVKCDVKFSHLISNLLGRTYIVSDIDCAIRLSKKYKNKYRIVTLEGELFNIGGSITGGSVRTKINNIFSRNRELKELERKISDYKDKLKVIEKQSIDLSDKLKKLYVDKEEIRTNINDINSNIVSIKENIKSIDVRSNLLKDKILEIELNKENINNQILDINNSINNKENYTDINEEKVLKNKEMIEKLNIELENDRHNLKESEKELVELKLELSELNQNKIRYDMDNERVLIEIEGLENEKQSYKNKINVFEYEIKELEEKSNKIKEEIKIKDESKKGLLEEINIQEKDIDMLKIKLSESDKKIDDIKINISKIQDELYKIDNKQIEYRIKKENLDERLLESYNLVYKEALEIVDLNFEYENEKDKVKNIRNNISKLGNVNVDAVEQYDVLKQRYDFIINQKTDIEIAEGKLSKVKNELLNGMKKQFKTEFNNINKNFSVIFKELFGGGEAKIKITDTDNILESGVDIIVQPPGKKLQSLSLLSGGERALTAISLLFAILKMRPSPFCILDEIEAALDDANVDRYADYIKKFSKNTQFLVITHRKGTMAVSDYLYGVTMQEKGISKVLSVKLEDAIED